MGDFGRTARLLAGLALLVTLGWLGASEAPGQTLHWTVSEFQPNIREGGRANAFAVLPSDNNSIMVASDTGGLFRSVNRGRTWRHVDSLPSFRTQSVAFVPSEPGTVVVTTSDDYKTSSGGGMWRSENMGLTWTQAAVPSGITDRFSAYDIAIAPDTSAIYVACDFGILISWNNGRNWSYQDVFGGGDRRVYSVVALGDNRVLAGGPAGVRRSENGGSIWATPVTDIGNIQDLHAFGRSTFSRQHAYVVNGNTNLFFTENSGQSWTQITSAPVGGGACGGISFVKAIPRTLQGQRGIELYFSNRCGASRLFAPLRLTTGRFDYTGMWENLSPDHGDTRDLAFDNANNPLILATDGGLHKTTDGGAHWTFVGGGVGGYNALQIAEIQGQYIEDIGRSDLYFGTQDNNLWSSGDGGYIWTSGMCCEGFYIEGQRRVSRGADSKITNMACWGCNNHLSNPLFTSVTDWRNPPGQLVGVPMIVRQSMHLQTVDDTGGFDPGFAVTYNLGMYWQQFATFPEEPRDIQKLARSGELPSAMVYQAIRTGWDSEHSLEIVRLARIVKVPAISQAMVYYPAMVNFGGLGVNQTMWSGYQVFAVDPGTVSHLIAADIVNARMMESHDSGESWTPMPELTNLVTNGGRLRFSNGIYPLVTTIKFSPQNPSLVMIGTSEGGLYSSRNNGSTWERIEHSEGVTWVTAIYWKTANDVIISTYGRGLWQLHTHLIIPRSDFEVYCEGDCITLSFMRTEEPDPVGPLFDRAILVYEGQIQGARVEAGILKEVFVTPGSSVVFAIENEQSINVLVTPTTKTMGYPDMKYIPESPKKGWITRGLVFGKDNQLVGAVFGDQQATMVKPDVAPDKEGQTKSPTSGKPYLRIRTMRFEGAPVASPDEQIQITGSNFASDSSLEILIDGRPADNKVQVDAKGTFKAEVRAPREFGMHRIEVRTIDGKGQAKVLDGSMFLVKHMDEPYSETKPDTKETKATKTPPSKELVVTSALLSSSPEKYQGQCPVPIKFSGEITLNGEGTVRYAFIRSDGAMGPVETLHFDSAGTKTVSTVWTLGGPDSQTYEGWQVIKILSPNVMESDKALFAFRCEKK